jgi:RHS repeat-associated protein
LTGATHGNQADEAYQYDANGNRINSGYRAGANNQLLNDGTYTYGYDGEGNRTRRVETATGKVTEYVWDYRNRLTSVLFKDAGGAVAKTIDYLYDGDNQRIGKRIDGAVTERYVLDRNQIALVFDGNGNQTHRYLYGTQIDQVLADETPARTLWALGDNQGTIRDLIDNGGSLVEHLTYDSFGKIISAPITDFRYGYTGREQDSETGLDYYRARYYDAANGKFISEDPLGFGAGDGNLTRYVGNSPTNAIDPSGLRTVITPIPTIPNTTIRPTDPRTFIPFLLWEILKPTPVGNSQADRDEAIRLKQREYRLENAVPNPNTCVITSEKENIKRIAAEVIAKGNKTRNRQCKYGYVPKADPLSRSSQYEQFVSGSQYEFAVVDLKTGEAQLYDGITPGTKNVWEAKAYLEQQALELRSIYRRGSVNTSLLSDKEMKQFLKVPRIEEQANRSMRVADKCGFNLKYASNSKVFKNFVQQDLTGFPRISVLYRPMPGIESIK